MTPGLGDALLAIARSAIAERLGLDVQVPTVAESEVREVLARHGATFVTLAIGGVLRGCVGSLAAHRPLERDCAENACAAAFDDRRFPALSRQEMTSVRVEVSLLEPSRPFPCADEADACARLVPGRDGVILSCGSRRATFLPQVWEQLPEPREFLAALKRKAGLPAEGWPAGLHLEVYAVEHVAEEEA